MDSYIFCTLFVIFHFLFLTLSVAYRSQKPDMGYVGGSKYFIEKRLLTHLLDDSKPGKFQSLSRM